MGYSAFYKYEISEIADVTQMWAHMWKTISEKVEVSQSMSSYNSGENFAEKIVNGKYKILCLTENDGMSKIYLCQNIQTERKHIMKVINSKYLDEYMRDVFLVQFRLLNMFKHPAILKPIEYFEDSDNIFIILDNVEGINLEQYLKRTGKPLREQEVVDYAIQAADVLKCLHACDPPVIHGDIKPRNLIMDTRGRIRVVNFGIVVPYSRYVADLYNRDIEVVLPIGYISPEQFAGYEDTRSDIYALGMTMHYLLTGLSPNESSYGYYSIRKINKKLSRKLEKIIDKCTANNPEYRYQTADELLKVLKKWPKTRFFR